MALKSFYENLLNFALVRAKIRKYAIFLELKIQIQNLNIFLKYTVIAIINVIDNEHNFARS